MAVEAIAHHPEYIVVSRCGSSVRCDTIGCSTLAWLQLGRTGLVRPISVLISLQTLCSTHLYRDIGAKACAALTCAGSAHPMQTGHVLLSSVPSVMDARQCVLEQVDNLGELALVFCRILTCATLRHRSVTQDACARRMPTLPPLWKMAHLPAQQRIGCRDVTVCRCCLT